MLRLSTASLFRAWARKMGIEFRGVTSSTVSEIGHDSDADELHVIWQDGKHSVYSGVSADKFESVSRAWSVGKALNDQVKPTPNPRYV